MNTDIASASVCYGLYDQENIIGFCAVLHQPHGVVKNLKRCSRLVILPDYQGIGLGTRFLNVIADYYKNKGYRFNIVTSAKNMIYALNKNDKWRMTSYKVSECFTNSSAIDFKRLSARSNCKTARFMYKG